MLSLDTHILIHAVDGRLTIREQSLLATNRWGISAIVLWELTKLHQLHRIALGISDPDFAAVLALIVVWPLDLAVCRQIPELDFRGDAADEIIAATAIVHNVPLLTRDRHIRASKLVPLA